MEKDKEKIVRDYIEMQVVDYVKQTSSIDFIVVSNEEILDKVWSKKICGHRI